MASSPRSRTRSFTPSIPSRARGTRPWRDREPPAKACLMVYDLNKLEEAVFVRRDHRL